MRVLIIEDNKPIARSLERGLKANYRVDIAESGQFGLNNITAKPYDLVLLDLNLPDMYGKDVCIQIRKNGYKMPVIVLTGSNDVQDKVTMLDIGADDYITKPFSLHEVRARMRAALRRTGPSINREPLVVADLFLDPNSRSVRRGAIPLDIRRKEFDILEYMMRNQGKTLTRAMIIDHVWDISEDLWANVVDVHIKHLRDKIDRPFNSRLIKTVHGVGYKLDAS
jgi:DNA-binding response OmpR family regulator